MVFELQLKKRRFINRCCDVRMSVIKREAVLLTISHHSCIALNGATLCPVYENASRLVDPGLKRGRSEATHYESSSIIDRP